MARSRRTPQLMFLAAALLAMGFLVRCTARATRSERRTGIEVPRGPSGGEPGPQPTPGPSPQHVEEETIGNLGLGIQALQEGRLEEARKHFEKIPRSSPHYPRTLNNLALIHESQGDLNKAEQLLADLIGLETDNAEAHADLGWVLYRRGRYRDAIEEAKKALALDNGLYVALYNIALCEVALEDAGLALRAYGDAIFLDKEKAGLKQAMVDLNGFIKDHPDNSSGLCVLALMTGFLRNPELQKSMLMACLDGQPPEDLRQKASDRLAEVLTELDKQAAAGLSGDPPAR